MSVLLTIVVAALAVISLLLIVSALPIRSRRTRSEVIHYIERFIDGTGGDREWDEFTCVRIKDPELDLVRRRCLAIDERFPPTRPGPYCDEVGLLELRQIVEELKGAEARGAGA